MAMPDKRLHRAFLVATVEVLAEAARAPEDQIELAQARVLLGLADAEWAREERAAELEALQLAGRRTPENA